MEIKIKYHNNRIDKIEQITSGDWIDLRAAETVRMKKGDFAYISLGISMKLPEGYEAHVAPRSSTFAKWGIRQTNGTGIIDNSFSGTNDIWKMPAYAVRDTEIKENDRICQFRIMQRMPQLVFTETESLDSEDRGGFGSTGER